MERTVPLVAEHVREVGPGGLCQVGVQGRQGKGEFEGPPFLDRANAQQARQLPLGEEGEVRFILRRGAPLDRAEELRGPGV